VLSRKNYPRNQQAIIHLYDGSVESVIHAMRNAKPQAVFHLASLYLTDHQEKDISDLVNSNILLGTQVLEAMTQLGVEYFVNAGTAWQQFSESNASPVNMYAATKQAFEAIVDYYADAKNISAVTLKIFDTYGPNDWRPKLVNLLIAKAKSGEGIDLSPGEQKIHLVHVDDIVDAFLIAQYHLQHSNKGAHKVYCLPSSKPHSVIELVQTIEELGGRPIYAKWGARSYRNREVMHPWLAEDVLNGWEEKIDLRTGIGSLI
jgi:nucleoside-diphosphate-sugar epimerase